MKKQELIEHLNWVRDNYSNDGSFTSGVRTGLGMAITDIEKLDEPEKIVIPQFVADWYEQEGSRRKWWNWFYKWGGNQSDSRTVLEKRALEWMQDFNEGLFVDIFRYGYEIEKEKLYYVIIPTKDPSGEYYYLDGFGGIDSAYDLKEVEHHTESFIRLISENLWQFAKEVTE